MKKKNSKSKKSGARSGKNNRVVPGPEKEYEARTQENMAALHIMKALKGPNNKYINSVYNALNSAAFTNASCYIVCLNGVGQGSSENARVGRLTKNLWLDLDLNVYETGSNGPNVSSYRVYVIAETTALGSLVTAAQFFVDAATFTPTSQRDRTNRNASRYVVLWDSGPFSLGTPTIASAQVVPSVNGAGLPSERVFSKHLPLNFQTDYSRSNNGNVTDIDTNSICLLACTDNATGGVSGITGAYTLCFQDTMDSSRGR